MGNKCLKKIGAILIMVSLTILSSQGYSANESRTEGPSVKSQVAKILLSSLGGAVLGVSTLSFYDKPQEHLSNVAVGGTVGALLGSIYVTKESLDFESIATLGEGGSFNVLAIPKLQQYGLSWGFLF